MKVDVKEQGTAAVLLVKGNLMGGPETLAVHEKVRELVGLKKTNVVIDLSGVAWINSSGLGMLMGCLTSIRNAGGEMRVTGVTEKVKNLFVITKLITLFETYETVDEAVASFGSK
ncbi:STAS domain-containing protein [bacterium]|nr:STAS domain-containing protein [bacterium]MDM7926788.1 STAS domain-containing protein [bacterium]